MTPSRPASRPRRPLLENIRDILADVELTDVERVELIADAIPEEFEAWARP